MKLWSCNSAYAGRSSQKADSIAIGTGAGQTSAGIKSIAIGAPGASIKFNCNGERAGKHQKLFDQLQ